jgi:hypothetical protein
MVAPRRGHPRGQRPREAHFASRVVVIPGQFGQIHDHTGCEVAGLRLLRAPGGLTRVRPVPDNPIWVLRNAAVTGVHNAETRWKHSHSYPWLTETLSVEGCGTHSGDFS